MLPWPYSIDQSMHVWLELQLQHYPGVAFTDAISRDCADLQRLIKRLDHEDIITQHAVKLMLSCIGAVLGADCRGAGHFCSLSVAFETFLVKHLLEPGECVCHTNIQPTNIQLSCVEHSTKVQTGDFGDYCLCLCTI